LQPVPAQESVRFGEDFEFDFTAYQLRRAGRALKLERIPLEILRLLIEQRGELVSRDQIVERIWGKGVFLDTDNSINGAIRKIRHALRDDSEQPRFVLTVTGRGYRFIAQVATEPVRATVPTTPASENRTHKLTYAKGRLALGGVVVFLALLGSYLQWRGPRGTRDVYTARPMLAVLPFQNLTGDPNQDYFSDGLTEEMLTQLGNLDPDHLGVIARTSVMHYKGSQAPLDQIGRELGVQYVIEGSVRQDAGRVRISAQLIQIKDQSHLWARQYDRERKDLLALQSEVAEKIADEIRLTLGDRARANIRHRTTTSAPPSNEAYDLYLKGLYFWNKRQQWLPEAAKYFQLAIAKDPNYAPAYAGLANTYGLMSTEFEGDPNELMPKARAAALRALQIDEGLPQPHTALALVAESYDYDWQTAERELRRAIELDGNYATAHQWYGEYLSWVGRFEEALSESEQARKLDPLSLIVASDRGAVLYRARQYEAAIAQFRAVLDMDPGFTHPYSYLVMCYVKTGRFTDALDVINRYVRPTSVPWAFGEEAVVYGYSDRKAEAEKALAEFESLGRTERGGAESVRLQIYIATRRNHQAIGLLQKLFAEHSHIFTSLQTDPTYDPLRSDPRFQDLLRHLKFPQTIIGAP